MLRPPGEMSFSCGLVQAPLGFASVEVTPHQFPLCRRYRAVLFDSQPIQDWGDGHLARRMVASGRC
jgi:hypothetical protein